MDELSTLKDISDIVTIPDNSLWHLITIIITGILLSIALFYYAKTIIKQRNAEYNTALNVLRNLDWTDAKTVAYCFTRYSKVITTEENSTQIDEILQQLGEYKYKKAVAPLSQQTINNIKEVIDV
jgi:hypothetical protein